MRKVSAFLLIFVLVFSFLGCDSTSSPYIPTGNGLVEGSVTKPTSISSAQKDLSLAYYPDRSLNPFECTDYVNRSLMDLLYQGLFTVDAKYQVSPMLCKNYSISRDMKTYVFYLEDATFSDGTALTAADVAASLKQAKKSGFYKGRLDNLRDVTVTAEGAVQVQLTTPYENLPLLLDIPIVKASEVTLAQPLGTGPFFFEAYEGKTWLRRNQKWWCSATLPIATDYISLRHATSPSQLRDEFELSDLGMVIADPGSVTYADFHSNSEELWSYESGVFLYLATNDKSKVFADPAIRQALTYAIDRSGLVNQYYRGFATPTTLPVSPSSPLYLTELASTVRYDPSRLSAAVEAAGLENNAVVLLVNASDGIRLRAARSIAAKLNECGLKVTTSELQESEYLKALKNGKFDLHLGQTKLSANGDLSAFFSSGGSLNFGGMNDPALQALCTDALANAGNYYTLYQRILADGQLCPILMRSYAVYSRRGAMSTLQPSRDHVFYYHLGKTMEQALLPENK